MQSVLEAKRLELRAERAADLMMPNPISLDVNSTLHDALVLFTEKGFTAAPVIDDAGQPVGVISRYDIVVHDRERTAAAEPLRGFQMETVNLTCVGDVMTPGVLSVAPDTPAANVLEEMLALKVHRLFVVDRTGVLVGVISALDFLKHLVAAT